MRRITYDSWLSLQNFNGAIIPSVSLSRLCQKILFMRCQWFMTKYISNKPLINYVTKKIYILRTPPPCTHSFRQYAIINCYKKNSFELCTKWGWTTQIILWILLKWNIFCYTRYSTNFLFFWFLLLDFVFFDKIHKTFHLSGAI